MEFQNIFTEKGLNSLIPFFSAIYLSYINPQLRLISLLLAGSIFIFYLIITIYTKEMVNNKLKNEKDIYKKTIDKENFNLSGIASMSLWVIEIITLILLYPYLKDAIAYSLFWLLIGSFVFNLLRLLVLHGDVVRKKFKGQI